MAAVARRARGRAGASVREGDRWFAVEASRDPKDGPARPAGSARARSRRRRRSAPSRARGARASCCATRIDGRAGLVRPPAARAHPSLHARPPAPGDRAGHRGRSSCASSPAGSTSIRSTGSKARAAWRRSSRQLAGFEVPAAAWEGSVLPARVRGYRRDWLDQLTLSGEVAWGAALGRAAAGPIAAHADLPRAARGPGRLDVAGPAPRPSREPHGRGARRSARCWRRAARCSSRSSRARRGLPASVPGGGPRRSSIALGRVTCDSFGGLRWLIVPASAAQGGGLPAGRWSLLPRGEALAAGRRRRSSSRGSSCAAPASSSARPLAREKQPVPWRDVARVLRHARGARRGPRRPLRRGLRRRAVRPAGGGHPPARRAQAVRLGGGSGAAHGLGGGPAELPRDPDAGRESLTGHAAAGGCSVTMRVRIGTSGSRYKEWKGSFYPEDLPAEAMLGYLRVEALRRRDQQHVLPDAAGRRARARGRSRSRTASAFALKASQRITHRKRLKEAGGLRGVLLQGRRRRSATGSGRVLFQLPPNLKKDLPRLAGFPRAPARRQPAAPSSSATSRGSTTTSTRRSGARGCRALHGGGRGSGDASRRHNGLGLPAPATPGLWRGGPARPAPSRSPAQPWSEAFVFFKHEDGGTGAAARGGAGEDFSNAGEPLSLLHLADHERKSNRHRQHLVRARVHPRQALLRGEQLRGDLLQHAPRQVRLAGQAAVHLPEGRKRRRAARGDHARATSSPRTSTSSFRTEELKALEEESTQTVDVTEFVPVSADRPGLLRQGRTTSGPRRAARRPTGCSDEALQQTGRVALAKYAARGKQYLVMLRPVDGGLVMQQLLTPTRSGRSPRSSLGQGKREGRGAEARDHAHRAEGGRPLPPRGSTRTRSRSASRAAQKKIETGQEISSSPQAEERRSHRSDGGPAQKSRRLAFRGRRKSAPAAAESRKPPKKAARAAEKPEKKAARR